MAEAPREWHPSLDHLRDVRRASSSIVKTTPVFSLGELSRRCGGQILLKAENLQRTGSFKLRGALAKLHQSGKAADDGVVAASAGNHGQALAYAARACGRRCVVFMPSSAPVSKVEAVVAFGAEVQLTEVSVEGCVEAARSYAAEQEMLFVHPFDDADVVAGQAGVGLELAEQVEDLARVVVPVGGGGLISGVATALKLQHPEIEVIGVQAAGWASFAASRSTGQPATIDHPLTIADGIAVERPGKLTLPLVERWVEDVVVVDDDTIAEAMVLLVERAKLVTEGAGAASVAALCSGAVLPAGSGATVALLSGGNVDAHLLASIINRHETGMGRRARLFMRISDRPGGLAALLQVLASAGGNVLDVTHVRAGIPLHVDESGVEILVETRSSTHRRELVESVQQAGYRVDLL